MQSLQKQRIEYLDYLRIAMSFLVVTLHVVAQGIPEVSVDSYEWGILNFYNSISRIGVPVFVMISGAVFLDKEKEITIKQFYRKNVLRIVVALLFWSFTYAVIDYVEGCSIMDAVYYFATGHYHLWFLYMLLGLYVMMPVFRTINCNKEIRNYFLIISIVATFFIPWVINIIRCFKPGAASLGESVFLSLKLPVVGSFAAYFILGRYLEDRKKNYSISKLLLVWGVGLITTFLLSFLAAQRQGENCEWFYSNFSVNVLLCATAMFLIFKQSYGKESRNRKLASQISSYSFGIYLIHPAIIAISIKYLNFVSTSFNPLIAIPLLSVMTWLISLAITLIIKKIPIIGKFIV